MSDVMLLGVLGMPRSDDPKELSQLDWFQLKDRIQEARERIVSDAATISRQSAEIERQAEDRRWWKSQCEAWDEKASEWVVEKDNLKAELSRLRAALGVAVEALDFYSYPWGEGDRVPDFYSEMNFGDRAHDALSAIRSAQESRAEEKDKGNEK